MAHREYSRRSFVKLAAGAVAASSLSASADQPAPAPDSAPPTPAPAKPIAPVHGSDLIKFGLIGCGGRGTGAATQTLRSEKGTVLHAMGDVFPDRLNTSLAGLHEEFKDLPADRITPADDRRFIGFDAYQRVIDSGVDLVLLTGYPHFRPQHLAAAVAANKHVFCEKPMAVDTPGLVAVREAATRAKAQGTTLVSGFCWRYADAERATHEQLQSGLMGDVITAHSTYHTSTLSKRPRQPEWSDTEFQMRNWWHFTWLSGDHLVEQAIHSVDRLAWAMRDKVPTRCVALGGRAAREGEESGHVFDHFAVVYEYDDGRRCFHTTRQIDHTPSDNTDYIYGTKGRCEINGWKPIHSIKDHSGNPLWSYKGPRRDMYQNEIDHLILSMRTGLAHNDGEWMTNSTMMALMGRYAAYTGQAITWDQAWASTQRLGPATVELGSLPVDPIAVPGKTKFI